MRIKEAVGLTHTGARRTLNEDAVLALEEPTLFAAADGMGGLGKGDAASKLAMTYLQQNAKGLAERSSKRADTSSAMAMSIAGALEYVFGQVHNAITKEVAKGKSGMATTLVTALITGGRCYVAHVGDSRAYLVRNGTLRTLTEDHTVAMAHLRSGKLTPEQYATSPLRSRLYQALGAATEPEIETTEIALANGDVVILSTDGLHNAVKPEDLITAASAPSLKTAGQRLIDQAVKGGVDDNLSLVMVRIEAEEDPLELDRIAQILGGVFLFQSLRDTEHKALVPYLDQRRLRPGEVLFTEGEVGNTFYVVTRGKLKVTKRHQTLAELVPGSHIGELALVGSERRWTTVTAEEKSEVYGLASDRFHHILQKRPQIGTRLELSVIAHLGTQVRVLAEQVQLADTLAAGEVDVPGMSQLEAIRAALSGALDASRAQPVRKP